MIRKTFLPALILVCALPVSAFAGGNGYEPPAHEMQNKKRMVVLDLTSDESVPNWGPRASVALTDALKHTWLWQVSARQDTKKVMAGDSIDSLYFQSPEEIRAVGQRLGATYVVYGRIGPLKQSAAAGGAAAVTQEPILGGDDFDRAAQRDGFLSARPGADVEIVEHAERGEAGAVDASLRVNVGIYDVDTGRTVLEHFYDERGTFRNESDDKIVEKLLRGAIDKLTSRLRSATNVTDGLILL